MKKTLALLLLFFSLTLPGCSSGSSTCNFSGLVAGATYLVVINNPNTGLASTFTRVANPSGVISVQVSNTSCSNVVVVLATTSNLTLSASPSSIYLPSPPSTATITGQSFDTTYGMPRVEYFDGSGYLVGSVYATSVSGDGTSLDASVPDLSYAYSGTYTIRVTNKTYQGYYSHTVGHAAVTAWGRDRSDSDGDGWYDDQDCYPYDPYQYSCTCGGYGNEPLTFCGNL